MSLILGAGTCNAIAKALALIPSGTRNSSRRISPGWIGRILLVAMLYLSVVINDFNIHWASVRPAEAHAPLVVDADAVLARPVTT
jgi:hypothetical protein